MKVVLNKTLEGSVLDIGGGGDGIIGRIYGMAAIAIDNRQEELDEAPDGFKKILMDARDLAFEDGLFDNVTFFYSLMFMDVETREKALAEAVRVLRAGGKLCIWDAEIEAACPEPFVVDLDIDANGEQLHTSYGIICDDANQTVDSLHSFCESLGLSIVLNNVSNGHFEVCFEKR